MTFPVTSKPTPLTVFNLQALGWVHCAEETGEHTGISRLTSKLVCFFLQIFEVVYFANNKCAHFKKFHKIYYSFFFKNLQLGILVYLLNALITSNFLYISKII